MQHTHFVDNTLLKTIDTIILAAGKSSRFKTKNSKLLFPLSGRPLLLYVLTTLKKLQLIPHIVTGHQEEQIKELLKTDPFLSTIKTVTQYEQKGTAHAVACALPLLTKPHTIIINGDMPLLSEESLLECIGLHIYSDADITLATAETENPTGYGRVILTDSSLYIQEEKNCSEKERTCTTVNAGLYIFKTEVLTTYIQKMNQDQKTGEFFLPDIINAALKDICSLKTCPLPFNEIKGINTLEEALEIEQSLQKKIITHWIQQGVTFQNPETITITIDCSIAPSTTIAAGVILTDNTHIGSHSHIGAYSILQKAQIADYVTVHPHSIIKQSIIESGAVVGPFAHIHTATHLEGESQIGNFVEVKKSFIGKKSKAKHLSYLGDTIMGESVNIGAGTITCNYDGFTKHQTIIHSNVSIGANTALVAPITIEHDAITAAGSTLTESVPSEALAIARSPQVNKLEYAKKRRMKFEEKNKNRMQTEQKNI